MIEINKNTLLQKRKLSKYQWKINSNTNWIRFKEKEHNNIINSKPGCYEELEKIIIQNTIEEI